MSNLRPVTAGPLATEAFWALSGFGLTLGQAVGSGGHLRARCRCGRQGPLDTGYWLSRRWQARLLVDLEDRLRCACGERRVMLEAAVGPVAPGDMFLLAM
ncbi:MAG: hypothetical protein J0I28_12535 [Caulobacterales bacterium]|nr:hypothetical protein [Caulobacterales bacterium]